MNAELREKIDYVRNEYQDIHWLDYSLQPVFYGTNKRKGRGTNKAAIVATDPVTQKETLCGIVNKDYFQIMYPEIVVFETMNQLTTVGFDKPSLVGNISGPYFRFSFEFESVREPVKVGDYVSPSLVARGANTGLNSVKLIPGAKQLVCSNGLVSPVASSLYSVIHQVNHIHGSLQVKIDEVSKFLHDKFYEQIHIWKRLSSIPIDFEKVLSIFANPKFPIHGSPTAGALKQVLNLVMPQTECSLAKLLDNNTATAWDLHNAVTQYLTHGIESLRSKNEFDIRAEEVLEAEFKTLD